MEMKYFIRPCMAVVTALMLTACDKDGDMLTIEPENDVTVESGSNEIVLDYENIDGLALTLNWTENGRLTISNPAVALPDGIVDNTVEMSLDDTFAESVAIQVPAGNYYYQFTVAELNSVMSRLGVEGGERAEVSVRIRTVIGKNIAPTYSDTLKLFITPYKIDMSIAYVLDKNQGATAMTLSSPESDGIYRGFVGVASWENWYLKEGTGVIWGNSSSRGTFAIASSSMGEDFWNMWYPGVGGCFFTTVNTVDMYWSALYIPSLTVGGDLAGEMVFDRKTCEWTMTVDTAAGEKNITISGSGVLYDMSTGDKDSTIGKTVALTGAENALGFAESSSTVKVSVASGGQQTMVLRLADPLHWTVSFEAGSQPPVEPAAPLLYISGHDDAVSGSWHFNNYFRLYNEEERAYGGACYFDSKWGYKFYKEAGNWDDLWSAGGEGDALAGTLKEGGKTNITAPEAGLYVVNAMIGALHYELTPVQTVSYAGLNDNWDMTEMTATDETGVYTAQVTKSAETPWGVKILINGSWDVFFGGGSGELIYGADGFDGDNDLAPGQYELTVDLVKGTYVYSSK